MQLNEGNTDVFVFIVQDTYGQPVDDEQVEYDRYFRELKQDFGRDFVEVDVAPGYSLPAFLADLKELVAPYSAEITLLVLGSNVIQHVGVYAKVAQAIKKFFVRKEILLNRNGATIVALKAVLDQLDGVPKDIRLERYFPFDPRGTDKKTDGHEQEGIADSVRTENLELVVHFITIVADGVRFQCTVQGKDIKVERQRE